MRPIEQVHGAAREIQEERIKRTERETGFSGDFSGREKAFSIFRIGGKRCEYLAIFYSDY
jgi:hypothetical protein